MFLKSIWGTGYISQTLCRTSARHKPMNLFLPSHCLDLFQKCARPKSQPHLPYLSSKIFRGAQGTHFQSHLYCLSVPLLLRGTQGAQLWPHSCPLFVSFFQIRTRHTLSTSILPSLWKLLLRGAQGAQLWPHSCPLFVLLYFRDASGAHFQPRSYTLSVPLLFRGAQGPQLWPIPALSLYHFISEAHKPHTFYPISTLSLCPTSF